MTPFESLIKAFPQFVVKNKTNVTKNIPLKDNEELVVPAHATAKVSSSALTGIPSSAYFKLVSPSIKDLIEYGIIEGKKVEPAKPAPVAEKASEDKSWDDKKKK